MNSLDKEIQEKLYVRKADKCFFCQSQQSHIVDDRNYDGKKYHCDTCGDYSVCGTVLAIENNHSMDFYNKLSAVAAELKLKGRDGYTLFISADTEHNVYDCKTLESMYPVNFMELLDRTLLNIAYLTDFSPIKSFNLTEEKYFYAFANDFTEAVQILQLLKERGDIAFSTPGPETVSRIHLTLKGYKRVRKAQLGQGVGSIAFVAMWFEDSNRMEMYRNAVNDAVALAGYKCKIVDTHEHNNFIMDEVINLINSAKFVIADFTTSPEEIKSDGKVEKGVRGGVYFEAGYARGKEKEVICTCYDDSASNARRHFDILQINTIFWTQKNESELIKKLYNRIIQSEKIGCGPLIAPQELKDKYKDIFLSKG